MTNPTHPTQPPSPEAQGAPAATLLPCPFCGSVRIAESFQDNTGGNVRFFQCCDCYAEGPYGNRKTIRDLWNTRTPTQSPPEGARDINAARLRWLHSPGPTDIEGYDWGIYRVKWENGKAVSVLQTRSDFSDLDEEMACSLDARDIGAATVAPTPAQSTGVPDPIYCPKCNGITNQNLDSKDWLKCDCVQPADPQPCNAKDEALSRLIRAVSLLDFSHSRAQSPDTQYELDTAKDLAEMALYPEASATTGNTDSEEKV